MNPTIIEYAPIILVVLYCIIHWHFAVTPEELEKKHRVILGEIDDKLQNYVTIVMFNTMSKTVDNMHEMVKVIYEAHISKGDK